MVLAEGEGMASPTAVHESVALASRGVGRHIESDEYKLVDGVLSRLVRRELRALRTQEAATGPPDLGEVMDLYRASGFLYPEKLTKLGPRLPAIERTWSRLLAVDNDIFKIWMRWEATGRVASPCASVCGFETEPGTWSIQHIVGLRSAPPTSIVTLINGIRKWGERRPGLTHVRLTYRPSNQPVRPLFDGMGRAMPASVRAFSDYDYAFVPLDETPVPPRDPTVETLRVISTSDAQGRAVIDFLRTRLSPTAFDALHFDEPRLDGLDARYQARCLFRRREILAAVRDHTVLGACVCNRGSQGMNFSFFENALTDITLAPELAPSDQRAVLAALFASACRLYAEQGHSELVVMADPRWRSLRRHLGYGRPDEKQYRSLTFRSTREAWQAVTDSTVAHYRKGLLRAKERKA